MRPSLFKVVQNLCFKHQKRSVYHVTLGTVTSTLPEICALDPENLRTHKQVYNYSLRDPENFWGSLAKSRLLWQKDFDFVHRADWEKCIFEWFGGGKLNATQSCIDRHAQNDPESVALIWEKDEPGKQEKITYKSLQSLTCRISNVLLSHGVARGSRVVLYMPVSPLAVASMLACARIGAVHSVVFAGFSADALATRLNDAQADTVITCDEAVRGGKKIPLKRVVDAAVEKSDCVKRVFMMERTAAQVPWNTAIDFSLEKEMSSVSDWCEPAPMNSEDPLFMLYTSGSTGKPKGIVHATAGYLLYAMLTHKLVFDIQPGDIFGCVADIGWITGHSYVVYGPLANGVTTVLFESVPTYPDPGRYWEAVQRLQMTHFYGAPTAIRLLLKYGDDWPKKYDTSSLRVLGSVGEPINHEAWEWYHDNVGKGKCMLVDTWWQTETGGICISPCPAEPNSPVKPAVAMRPFYGIQPALLDEKCQPLSAPASGALCLQKSWPGMASTIYGDHQRYVDTYFKPFPGYYCTGDGAHTDADGDYGITGRMDDVLNVSGHRLGTAEIEDVLDEHPEVAETAVVPYPHDIKGDGIFAFVILKGEVTHSDSEIIDQLKSSVKKAIAGYAVPDKILVTPALPKTRSGKIMRRILRKIAVGSVEDIGDTSTLAEPGVVTEIYNKYKQNML